MGKWWRAADWGHVGATKEPFKPAWDFILKAAGHLCSDFSRADRVGFSYVLGLPPGVEMATD